MPERLLPSGGVPPALSYPGSFQQSSGGSYPPRGPSGDEEEIHLRDLWFLVVRNRWLIVGSLALSLAVALTYASRATPIFQAGASIRIDENQSNIPVLDVLKEVSAGSELATEMEVLRSRSLALEVVDSLGLQVQVAEPRGVARSRLMTARRVSDAPSRGEYIFERVGEALKLAGSEMLAVPGSPMLVGGIELIFAPRALEYPRIHLVVPARMETVAQFGRALAVSRPARDANVVIVRYQGTDPDLVAQVPNALAQTFISRRSTVKKTEATSTVLFLRKQIDTLQRQLTQAEDSLRSFRESAQVVSLTDEASSQVQNLARLQAERSSIESERAALASLLEEVRRQATSAGPGEPSPYRRLLAFPTLLRNPAISQLLASLNEVENQKSQLLVRRTERDPDVLTLAQRVKAIEEQVRSLSFTYLQGLGNQVASIDTELAKYSAKAEQVPAKEVQFARLARRPKVLEEIYTMLQSRLKEAEIAQAVEDPSVRVIDYAVVPEKPIKPNKPLIVLLGGMFGLMAGIGGAFLRQALDRKVRSREDVLRLTGAPVLGVIPRISAAAAGAPRLGGSVLKRLANATSAAGGNGRNAALVPGGGGVAEQGFASRLVTGHDPRNPVSEAYRTLRTNITFARMDAAPRTIVFTSPMPGDGKTTSASNLAITLAQQGQRVLLVDADMRRGMINTVFNAPREPGLSNVLLGRVELAKAVRRIELGPEQGVDFLATGTLPPNPAELLGSDRMKKLIHLMESNYDTVILDSPPLNIVTDAALLGTSVDGVLVVVRAGTTDTADLEYAMVQLANVRAPVLGVVLNDVDVTSGRYGYGGNYRYYQYYYSDNATS